jgi:hypothetical protein
LRPAFRYRFWSFSFSGRHIYDAAFRLCADVEKALELYDAIVTEKSRTLTIVSVDE